jgi:uncharacterized protein
MFWDIFELTNLTNLSKILEDFVKESTKTFDDSHNHEHMLKVLTNSFEIIVNDPSIISKVKKFPDIPRLTTIVAWLHDVRDHKYPDSIGQEELESFIKSVEPNPVNFANICKIINNISWSKEAKGLRDTFEEPYQTVLDIVSDADRLEALGKIGIERCETFTREHGGIVPKDVIKHCHEKLLRILPEGFIKTTHGIKLAQPLHDEIVEYVQSNEQGQIDVF